MQIDLNVRLLIDLARENSKMSFGEMAADLERSQSRISEWRNGKSKPDANEIAYFAEKAGLPVFQTVAEIEAQLNARYAAIWRNALGKLTAAGVAATLGTVMVMTPPNANASPSQANANHSTLYIM